MPKCQICGKMYRMITPTHLKKHNITIAQYREMFPDADISEKDIRSEKVRREDSKRMRVVSKRNWADPELRERMIKSSVEARSTPEFHELRSQITREYHEQHPGEASRIAKIAWEDPAYRKRQQELGKARWEDPEYREHITECLRRRADDPEYVEKMRKARQKQRRANTSIEIILYSILDKLGVEYKTQVPIGRYIVDALVEDWLVLEAYGDYWHNYPDGLDYDRVRSEQIRGSGFQVFPFWEHQLNNDPNGSADRITYMMDCT